MKFKVSLLARFSVLKPMLRLLRVAGPKARGAISRIPTIGSTSSKAFATSNSSRSAGLAAVEKSKKFNADNAEAVQAILSNYFAKHTYFNPMYVDFLKYPGKLPPAMIASMVAEITKDSRYVDSKIADDLVQQATRAGGNSKAVIETLINFFVESQHFAAAATVLCKCDPAKIAVSERICQGLINGLVENCNWDQAFVVSLYMIALDYRFSANVIFFTVGGLMRNTEGAEKSLELMKMITLKKRMDIADLFSMNKVIMFYFDQECRLRCFNY